jgi:predicted DNA-binding protein (UPF0251 family)
MHRSCAVLCHATRPAGSPRSRATNAGHGFTRACASRSRCRSFRQTCRTRSRPPFATDLEAIWAAISNLPRHQRRALLLRELGGLSYHELGRAFGVSHSAVESLLFRARRHVRKLVAAATPLAFRDELSRLIPGLDPQRRASPHALRQCRLH